jgi:hypothetical protein
MELLTTMVTQLARPATPNSRREINHHTNIAWGRQYLLQTKVYIDTGCLATSNME